jgi:hypothetical protein
MPLFKRIIRLGFLKKVIVVLSLGKNNRLLLLGK